MTWGQIRQILADEFPGLSVEQLNSAVEQGYQHILRSRTWPLLRKTTTFLTAAIENDGTVAATHASTGITGTGTSFTTAMAGRRIRIVEGQGYYTIQSVNELAQTLILDRGYEGDTTAASSYQIWVDLYTVAADCRMVESITNPRVGQEPIERFDEPYLEALISGWPEGETTHWAPSTDQRQVRIWPVPTESSGLIAQYQPTVTGFTGTNTGDSPLAWVTDEVILEAARGKIVLLAPYRDLKAAQMSAVLLAGLMKNLGEQEARREPTQQMRMASRFTRHRHARWLQ